MYDLDVEIHDQMPREDIDTAIRQVSSSVRNAMAASIKRKQVGVGRSEELSEAVADLVRRKRIA